ncbi:MAG: hypothetical protein ACRENQ_17005, partial [Gemmatimonadaceae bacterium]
MRKLLTSCALLAALVACSHGPPDPELQFATVGFILQLPAGMQSALDAVAPNFQTVHIDSFRSDVAQAAALAGGGLQAMFATIGDYNGDGSKDAIVEGVAPGDSALRVIAIMNGATPKAFEVARYPLFDADAVGVYLSKAPNGKQNAFEVVNYPYGSELY